jgi:urease accessory protein
MSLAGGKQEAEAVINLLPMKISSKATSAFHRVLPLGFLLLLPSLAQAHPGLPGHAHGFSHGLLHPLTGLDHICAMVAVGLWAAQRGGRALWLVPATFVSVMIIGGTLGMGKVGIPYVEQGIAASVLVLGILIAAAIRLPVTASMAIVGLFALFHGYAHGAEMPDTASGFAYGIGFIVATASLHLAGLGLGLTAKRFASAQSIRYVGGAIAACGVYFCFAL